ncbi:hypothetical protein [Parasphingorhabdus pacifica]
MVVPVVSRLFETGFGTGGSADSSGPVTCSWVEQRLSGADGFWTATECPDGPRHLRPGWGAWDGDAMWFSAVPCGGEAASSGVRVGPGRAWWFVDRIYVKSDPAHEDLSDEEPHQIGLVERRQGLGVGGSPTCWVFRS